MALRLSVHDATGGYRAYRAEALREPGLHNVQSQGYCFQIELAARAVCAAKVITEVPITFTERALGSSKMSRAIVAEALVRVTQWGITRRFRPDRR